MNLVLRGLALVIDTLQFLFFVVFLAFQAMTPIGGGIAGGATGAVVCWKFSNGVWEGITNAATCAAGGAVGGAALSALAAPIGMAIDVAISSTFGVLLIALLWTSGRLHLMPVVFGFVAEMTPGINAFVPGWSLLVHRCIQQHKLKERGVGAGGRAGVGAMGVLGGALKLVPGAGVAAAALKPVAAVATYSVGIATPAQTGGRTPLKTFDGIRPANDNAPSYANAA